MLFKAFEKHLFMFVLYTHIRPFNFQSNSKKLVYINLVSSLTLFLRKIRNSYFSTSRYVTLNIYIYFSPKDTCFVQNRLLNMNITNNNKEGKNFAFLYIKSRNCSTYGIDSFIETYRYFVPYQFIIFLNLKIS